MAETNTLTPDMLTKEGVETLWGVITNTFEPSVDGKGLSTNDFTDEYKTKLETMQDTINNDIAGAWVIKGTLSAVEVNIPDTVEGETTIPGFSGYLVPAASVDAIIGNVYSVIVPDNGTFGTYASDPAYVSFISDEQGNTYPSGTNIVYTENGWDTVAGAYNFSDMIKKSEVSDLTDEEVDDICKMYNVTGLTYTDRDGVSQTVAVENFGTAAEINVDSTAKGITITTTGVFKTIEFKCDESKWIACTGSTIELPESVESESGDIIPAQHIISAEQGNHYYYTTVYMRIVDMNGVASDQIKLPDITVYTS